MHGKQKNKTTWFLISSLIVISILTVLIFSVFAFIMNQRSTETISDVGKIYMDGMGERISLHFASTSRHRHSGRILAFTWYASGNTVSIDRSGRLAGRFSNVPSTARPVIRFSLNSRKSSRSRHHAHRYQLDHWKIRS